MRVLFAGTPQVALPSLEAILASEHELIAVLTRPDARSGRGRTLRPSPVKALAEQAGIEVLTPRRVGDRDFLDRLTKLAPDACPVVAYGGLIPPAALSVPRHGWVNLHFSLLPAWRGAAPVQHAIIAGDDVTGATTFVLDEGLDTGPVIGTMTQALGPTDTAGEVLDRLATAGAGLLVASLDAVAAGTAHPRAQPVDGVSHAPRLTVEDARVRWGDPAVAVDRRIRGCTPAPGAWTTFRGARVKLAPVRPGSPAGGATLTPGAIRAGKHAVHVGTASTPVELTTVQPPGRRPLEAADWTRGARVGDDERFEP